MDHITEQLVDAVRNGHSDHIDALIEAGADPLVRDSWILRLAAMNGDYTMVDKLLPHCDPMAQNSAVLRLAAEHGCVKCVALLLPHCNPKELKSKALVMAAQNGHLDVVELLAPVSDVFDEDDILYKETPIYAALVSGNPEIVKCVLKNLSSDEKEKIDYNFWARETLRAVDTKKYSEIMACFKMFDPQNHLTVETASEICSYEYHRLDAEAVRIVLDRAYDNGYSFVTAWDKYRFLNLPVVLGRTDLLPPFFEREFNSEYLVDLLKKCLELWSEHRKIPVEKTVAGLQYIASACQENLASELGDSVLLAASKTHSEALFTAVLPYCNLERTYLYAQGNHADLELLERYNSVRVNKLLNEHVHSHGGSHKRKM